MKIRKTFYKNGNLRKDYGLHTVRKCELELSYGTLWGIKHLDLHLHPYKVHFTQQLKPANHLQRRRYVERLLEQHAVNGNFSNKMFV